MASLEASMASVEWKDWASGYGGVDLYRVATMKEAVLPCEKWSSVRDRVLLARELENGP